MFHRQKFEFTDTGTQADTSPSLTGEIMHMRWHRANASTDSDTGPTVSLTVLPDAVDTGAGFQLFSGVLSASLTNSLRVPGDTGYSPVVVHGDKLKADCVKPAGDTGNTAGSLYVWLR